MAWDDKPPSDSELAAVSLAANAPAQVGTGASWDSHPPRPEELMHSSASKDIISKFADRLRGTGMDLGNSVADTGLGVAQGATFGFADELQGGAQAGLDAIVNGQGINPLNPEFLKKYRAYQKEAEKPYKEAEDRSPWLYGAGNIAGGVITAPVLGAAEGGLGIATAGGRAAVKAALEEGGMSAAAKAAGKSALLDAVNAAPAGALYGAGMSEGGVDTPEGWEKLKNDTGYGALTGGILGGGIGLASSVLPNVASSATGALKNKIGERDGQYERIIKKSFKAGLDDVDIGDEAVKGQYLRKPYDDAEKLVDTMDRPDDMYGGEIGKVIKSAQDRGDLVDISEPVREGFDNLVDYAVKNPSIEFDPKTLKIIKRLSELGTDSGVTPDEARQLKANLDKVIGTVKTDMTVPNQIKKNLLDLRSGINDSMVESIDGLGGANSDFTNFRRQLPEQIIAGNKNPETAGTFLGKLKNPDGTLTDRLTNLIKGATKEGTASEDAIGTFSRLQTNLKNLEQTNPEAFAAMSKTPEEIQAFAASGKTPEEIAEFSKPVTADSLIKQIRDSADDHTMVAGFHQKSSNEGWNLADAATGLWGSGKSVSVKLANKTGLYGPSIVDAAGKPFRLTKKTMFDLPLSATKAVADHLASADSPAIKNMGEALQKAVANEDAVGKNAVLFSIMQNPNTRRMLNLQDDDK